MKQATSASILVIRLGAMGDIIHALPAVASLKKSFPRNRLAWLIAPRWTPLLEGNPFVDELIPFERGGVAALRDSWRRLRSLKPDLAFDFQGLVQSALSGRAAKPKCFFGFDQSVARERMASVFYTHRIAVSGPHRVERNLQLVEAAGASELTDQAWIPFGRDEGSLPSGPFVLTNPFAGWKSKQWPIEYYDTLAQRLQREGLQLVANVSEQHAGELADLKHVRIHTSSLLGLIAATRQATAVLGLDSGPLHLAAALSKPGVALFGLTDPLRTGPYGGRMTVLRVDDTATTYKRHDSIHASMKAILPEQVAEALLASIANHAVLKTLR
ncbi:MAG: glycosyltransferase family 9 protein [Bryobacteraceae bacterium]